MIARLSGVVTERGAGFVVVDVHGVGYLVHVTDADRLPAPSQDVVLHTSLQVREDSMTLYGFPQAGSRRLFELLLSSSGVGPKLALAALGTLDGQLLRAAIAAGDIAVLTRVPGIGKKVAERLVLELRDKVGGGGAGTGDTPAVAVGTGGSDDVADVREALVGLGYPAAQAQVAVNQAVAEGEADTQELLRRSLRLLASGADEGSRR